ncbi:glucose 1-dehydrogenase [Maribacter sp. PR1]|uniref:Glucose 1-dehydrogenase n=1 Tax=Maribacter cobaltidurans TaxID=1178778 RepID=A0ABU7IQ54_9FLAO|nr:MULTISPECIES: glucose 1-dehydrogenase [Maribacter]MDC6387696.1 glucose 1-dehydrogenase [Maribacter sp. PR1]MEE1975085.1 glucose 1-dehydrogenase [Maribacter cobaltidurans]
MRLDKKIALVTGAGKGIGKEIAEGFAVEGAIVIINDLPGTSYAQEVVDAIKEKGGKAELYATDVSNVENIRKMFAYIQQEYGQLDVLVNNAGITGWSDFFNTDEVLFDKVIGLNIKGTLFCAIEAARMMKENGKGGSIINISSICSVLSVKNLICYSTSKGGIEAMSKQMAVELAPYNIRVNTFGPGPINTERNLSEDPDYKQNWGSVIPMKRTGEPEEMIGPAIFLASDESSYVTGQLFYVDGGWSVQGKFAAESMDSQLQNSGGKG